ncbi:diamine N-acetyltransferase [Acidovorax soli]|uniref:Diamine N-acetyltransferase n=1 Tax=Acidovorax soli TaxID=592050 RepID=A0A7X0U843_9BURK|nr:GNAT family N-acetyltransferase [Acidovorax soli]MBB6558120.1 diamine N-acetyltransferase [Acidovorax soli]
MPEPTRIREAGPHDAAQLLAMMRALAVFEGYADAFEVTERDLLERGLACSGADREFGCLVAQAGVNAPLAGYAVWVQTRFTFDLQPTLVLKELWVQPAHRRRGLGEHLFNAVRAQANAIGAARLQWLVLPGNAAAQRMYARCGGRRDTQWEHWELPPEALRRQPG